MKEPELPLSFVMNLAQNEAALRNFEAMSKDERNEIISQTHSVKSRKEMRNFVNNLSDNRTNIQ